MGRVHVFGAICLGVALLAAILPRAQMPAHVCSTVVVAGATGAIGRAAVSQLAAQGRNVIALTRRAVGLEVFPGLRDPSRVTVRPTNFEDPADVAAAISGADAVLSCVGTSRVNPEVKASMERDGADEGFAEWLQRVDVGYSVALAKAAAAADKVRFFARVSANNADAELAGGGFNVYWRHQGLADNAVLEALRGRTDAATMRVALLRPGRLDRGEDLRALRAHEVEKHRALGPGLSVAHVAAVMLLRMEAQADRTSTLDDAQIRAVEVKCEL